jgi:hypothetical protein
MNLKYSFTFLIILQFLYKFYFTHHLCLFICLLLFNI